MAPKAFTLAKLAELTNSTLVGNPEHLITGVADLETASSTEASFFANAHYEQQMLQSKAGVIFITEEPRHQSDANFLVNPSPSRAFQAVIEAFFDPATHLSGFSGIHPTAVIHDTANLGEGVTVGPHAVIDQASAIGARTHIGSGVYIGPEVKVGEDCLIYPNVVIRERSEIGHRVTLQPGVVLGSCGFGYTTDEKGHHTPLQQVGKVKIGDDVEVGANSAIDRARFQCTEVGEGTKIDNLVQIGHAVKTGKHCLIVAQTGIAGSTELGNSVILAGQVGVNGHIKLGDGVTITAMSGVSKSIKKPGVYRGLPAIPMAEFNRLAIYQRRAETTVKTVADLEKRVEELEQALERLTSAAS